MPAVAAALNLALRADTGIRQLQRLLKALRRDITDMRQQLQDAIARVEMASPGKKG